MSLEKFQNIQFPASADLHVHLRENEVCEAVTRTIRQGGVNTVTLSDRNAILRAAVSGNPKFFLGTDSAPHPISAKFPSNGEIAAGVFTQPYATQLVLSAKDGRHPYPF